MGLGISSEDFIGRWSLSFSDTDFVNGKPGPARLGLALQLKFFAAHGFFVQDHAALPADGVLYLAEQLGLEADAVNHYGVTTRKWRICPTFKNVSGTQVGLTVDVVAFSALRAS